MTTDENKIRAVAVALLKQQAEWYAYTDKLEAAGIRLEGFDIGADDMALDLLGVHADNSVEKFGDTGAFNGTPIIGLFCRDGFYSVLDANEGYPEQAVAYIEQWLKDDTECNEPCNLQ